MYILKCADGSFYVGSTRDLDRRMFEHGTGVGAAYTRKRLPVELVFAEEYAFVHEAYEREKQVQGWSRRKREALIAGHYDLLPNASRGRFGRESRG
ncbi:GIY-YIG nuclease family protein [Lacisediminihabitans sp. FW035]